MQESRSLVKMPSTRVAELCHAMIEFSKSERAEALAPFEADILAEMQRRAAVKRRWFRQDAFAEGSDSRAV